MTRVVNKKNLSDGLNPISLSILLTVFLCYVGSSHQHYIKLIDIDHQNTIDTSNSDGNNFKFLFNYTSSIYKAINVLFSLVLVADGLVKGVLNPENLEVRNRKSSNGSGGRLFFTAGENVLVNLISIIYNVLNSNTNFNSLDSITSAITRLGTSQGFTGIVNILTAVSNVAQTYGSVIAGVDLEISKRNREEDSLSAAEVSDRLQASIDELNYRQTSTNEFLLKVICRYINSKSGIKYRGIISIEDCSKAYQFLHHRIDIPQTINLEQHIKTSN